MKTLTRSYLARHLGLAALALLFAWPSAGAQTQYSASPEYQEMIHELHQPAPSPAYMATGHRPVQDLNLRVKMHQDKLSLRLDTGSIALAIDKISFAVSTTNLQTKAVWQLTQPPDPACATSVSGVPTSASATDGARHMVTVRAGHREWTLLSSAAQTCSDLLLEVLDEATIRATYSNRAPATATNLNIHLSGGLPLFGLGERFWQAALHGTSLEVRPADKSGEPGHAWVYVATPFVVSPGGLGFYADTVFDSRFRFNPGGTAFDVSIANQPVSFYLMAGAGPKEILTAYTGITGRPQNPPLWTFGPWINSVQGKDAVLEMATRIRTQGIPASALWVFDIMDEPHNLGWPFWYSSYYGNPRAFTDELHTRGFKVLNYVHPYVRQEMIPYPSPSPAYQKGVDEKLLQLGADGLPAGPRFEPVRTGNIDFTNPAAVDWWQGMITSAVRDQGFDGWMEDFGEWIADTDTFAAGKGATVAEVYPLLYHKITLRIAQSLNPSVAPFSRSGSSGSQQFSPVLWGADQAHNWSRDYGLPSVVTAGITAGLSGFSTWGPDILSDGDSKELWMRWAEFGALTPVMRDHVWAKPQNSINLWSDADTQAQFKKYALLHSSLLPFFATLAAEAHATGVPIIRHLMLEYPNDPRSYGAEYEYLLGKDLLVAPVIEPGATKRTLYLPPGEWVSYWSGARYQGAQDVTVPAPLDEIPILVRAGAVLPFLSESETASLDWASPQLLTGPMEWRIFLGAGNHQDSTFTLPDQTTAHLQYQSGELRLDGTATMDRDYQVILRAEGPPTSIQLENQPLPAGQPGESKSGWWYEPADHSLHIRLRSSNFHLLLQGLRTSAG